MKVASMSPNPPSSNGPAPNLGLNKASYSAHLNRNYGKRPCHRHWDPLLGGPADSPLLFLLRSDGQDPFYLWDNPESEAGEAPPLAALGKGSKAKAGELQWPTGHYLPVNWVFCYWELIEGRLVLSHIHLKHPVEQHPENWISTPGRPQTFGG